MTLEQLKCALANGDLPKHLLGGVLTTAQKYVLDRIVLGDGDSCWEWLERLDYSGYGLIGSPHLFGALAHRASYEAFIGPIPEGLQVRHQCHNRKCCNPEHLLLGTNLDNTADSMRDGRKMGSTYGSIGVLSEDSVSFIRRTHASGVISYAELAELLGVTYMTIYNVVKRRTWKGLE